MWPRTVEVMLGLWLAASPFLFRHPPGAGALWLNDLGVALLAVTLSLFSFWRRARRAHLLNLPVALWLVGFGYLTAGDPASPAAQNQILIGLILLMLAVIPSEAAQPPPARRSIAKERAE